MPQHHATAPRGREFAPRSIFLEGRFGRLFRNLPSFEPSIEALKELAKQMQEPEEGEGLDGSIPAGYTYLGQFIDHDITFDPVSSLQRQNDPDSLHDFRTPRLDLDSLYGDGPSNDPYLYDPDVNRGRTNFLIGKNANGELDLPRNVLPPAPNGIPRGRALIGDPRNDENVIVGQMHLLFLRLHNKVVERLAAEEFNPGPGDSTVLDRIFEEAQRQVRWHYQWIVMHDFLPKICGEAVVKDILKPDEYETAAGPVSRPKICLEFYKWQREPFMPVEFSVAAYRFGHSMIRPTYNLKENITDVPIFTNGDLQDEHSDLRGFRPLAREWTIDWSFFFGEGPQVQLARKIDTKLSLPLQNVPEAGDPPILALRNLERSSALGLPSGQRVARAMGMEPMRDETLGISGLFDQFVEAAPLWFYVLKEAEFSESGQLGPVGGRIVAEVLLGLVKGDPFSFVNVEPNWKPTLGPNFGSFTMKDLVDFVEGQEPPPPPPPNPSWGSAAAA